MAVVRGKDALALDTDGDGEVDDFAAMPAEA